MALNQILSRALIEVDVSLPFPVAPEHSEHEHRVTGA
jgi:hypothetical protein